MKRVVIMLITASILCVLLGTVSAETRLEYSVKGAEETENIIWSIEQGQSQTVLSLETESRVTRLVCDSRMNTREWQLQDLKENSSLTARRSGQVIHVEGNIGENRIDTRVELEPGQKWYQTMNHQYSCFVLSGAKKEAFVMLRPDTMELSNWVLTRQEEETLLINGRSEETVRVRLTVKNVPAFMWKAELWYRISDGRFLRYEGPMGGPGAPEVTTSLVEEVPAI